MRRLAVLTFLASSVLVLAGCSGSSGELAEGERLRVVATTAILGDFARQVAGPDADVSVVIPAGVDVHSFEPSPSVARDIAGAHVVILNGYHLEESVLNIVAENKARGATVVIAAKGLEARAGGHEDEDEHDEKPLKGLDKLATAEGDPHLWLSVAGARKYVENIRDGLASADKAHAAGYGERASKYLESLTALEAEIRETVAKVPQDRRQIVAFHDAYGYFGDAYGFTLTAAVLPGGANQQVSAQKIAEVVAAVRKAGVKTIYRETEFDPAVVEAIAKETGTRVLTLYSIYAGPVTDYAGMMRANAKALVDGLAG
ncbi:MAG: zinc ABC transporter substrate-binding protein [Chloroflexi bacterium]|nr:metal ABC transporter substrate-binding protein [Chloroflexota bacterium]MQC25818.1 zinc ABC transporter substrate-binding protein [Chloroflexota bacterium]